MSDENASTAIAFPSQVDVDTSAVGGVPYLTFTSIKSPKFSEYALQFPGLKEPDPLLVLPAPESPLRLIGPTVFLVAAKQLWVDGEEDGTINKVYTEEHREDPKIRETIEAILLVHHDGLLYPSRCTFRTTKCNGAKVAAKALKMAETEAWGRQSPEFAASMQIPIVWARFTATFSCIAKTARASGRKYWLTQVQVKPTTAAQLNSLTKAMTEENFILACRNVNASYHRRLEELATYV